MKLLLLITSIVFLSSCVKQEYSKQSEIKRLESQKNLDELDKAELENLRALSKNKNNTLMLQDALNSCKTKF